MIWIKTAQGECLRIAREIYVARQKNGTLVRIPRRYGAQGVSDGEQTWSLGGLQGYPAARLITRAEYEEYNQSKGAEQS